jgi:hypothetical protein
MCLPKDCGGLGIQNLEIQNRCILSKWLFKLINEDGIWQYLLRRKYLSNKTLSQTHKQQGNSHFWAGLMKVKDHSYNVASLKLTVVWTLDSGKTFG